MAIRKKALARISESPSRLTLFWAGIRHWSPGPLELLAALTFLHKRGSISATLAVFALPSVAFSAEAQSRRSLSVGSSSEYAQVSTLSDDAKVEFSLVRPLGLSIDLRLGGMSDQTPFFIAFQGQVPGSLARLESRKLIAGIHYFFHKAHGGLASHQRPVEVMSARTLFPYLSAGLVYHNLFFATLDLDGLPVVLDRSAFGILVGFGADWTPSFLNPENPEWRPANAALRGLNLEGYFAYGFASPGVETTTMTSAALLIRYREPL